jgi:6-phosphogluconolactonase
MSIISHYLLDDAPTKCFSWGKGVPPMQALSRSIHLSVHVHKDPAAMAERAAHILAAACEEAVGERGVFKVALSGGQTPIPLFRLLVANDWADHLPWSKITFFWVDERCVGPDHPESNYGLVRRELLSRVQATHFFRMRGEEDPVQAAAHYEQILRKDFSLADNELPRFDFMLLGLGKDGHTGSIFPGSPALAEKKRLVIDQYVAEHRTDRLTLTLPVINNARCCMFLVTGEEKHHVLSQSLNLLTEPTLPAQMVRPSGGDLIWIVDEAAATGR